MYLSITRSIWQLFWWYFNSISSLVRSSEHNQSRNMADTLFTYLQINTVPVSAQWQICRQSPVIGWIIWIGALLWSSYLLTPPRPLFCSRVPLRSSVVPQLTNHHRRWFALCLSTDDFISVSFCTAYIIVTFRVRVRVRVRVPVRVWDR